MSEEKKKPFYGRGWFVVLMLILIFPVGLILMWTASDWSKKTKWIVTVILGVIVLFNLGGGDSEDTEVKEDENNSGEEVSEESESEVEETEVESEDEPKEEEEEGVESEESEVGLGTPLNVGKVEFTINSWEQRESVGSEYMEEVANDTYIVMEVNVVNNGSEAITIDSSYFKILSDGNTYEPDTLASTYANESGVGLFFEDINPGSSRNALVVFDVAQGVVENEGKQVQVQSGIWGTETGIINLK